MFSTGFTSFSVFISSIDHLFGLYAVFDAISSNIDEVLSIDPSANVFVFGDFNTLAMEILKWSFLKCGGRTTHGPIYQNFSLTE